MHFDLWGLAPITTTASFRWFVTFIDDCTRVSWVYMLRYKKNVLPVFHKFVTMVQTQFSMNIKTLRSDNIDEYIGQEFRQFCDSKGIIYEITCPYTPQ
jgi:transposase InsO family protein